MKKIILLISIFAANVGISQYISSESKVISDYSTYNNNSGINITSSYLHPVDKSSELKELYPDQNFVIQYWYKNIEPDVLEENIQEIMSNLKNTNELYSFLLDNNYELMGDVPGNGKEKPNVIENWYYDISFEYNGITLIVPSRNDDQWIEDLFPGTF